MRHDFDDEWVSTALDWFQAYGEQGIPRTESEEHRDVFKAYGAAEVYIPAYDSNCTIWPQDCPVCGVVETPSGASQMISSGNKARKNEIKMAAARKQG